MLKQVDHFFESHKHLGDPMSLETQNSDSQNPADDEEFEIFELEVMNQPTLQHDQ